jgi:ribokinase
MFDFVGIGHILYDTRSYVNEFPKPDRMSFVKGIIKHSIGGSATNVVCNLSKLGFKTAIIAKVGADDHGKYLIDQLKELKVSSRFVKVNKESPTGVSMVVIQKDGEPLLFEMLGANEPIRKEDVSVEAIRNSGHLHMSGSTLSVLAYAASLAKRFGKTVSFDPGRSKSQMGFKMLLPILKNVDILITNKVELGRVASMSGKHPGEILHFLESKMNGKTIIVKGGGGDTIVQSKGKRFSVSTLNVKIVDTIGAGDAFTAGFLSKFIDGKDLEECTRFANACGSLKVTREGAAGLPAKKEVQSFYRGVRDEMRVKKADI